MLGKRISKIRRTGGVSTVEFALLVPLLFAAFAAIVQFVIYLQSSIVTNYASFAAARAFAVYGDRNLASIAYPYLRSEPFTNAQQTVAEAAAEKVVFESLLWEQRRLKVYGGQGSSERYYEDGNQAQYDGAGYANSAGAVQVNFIGCGGESCETGTAVEVVYCMPIVFPGAKLFFSGAAREWPCKVSAFGRSYDGVAIAKKSYFPREPLEK